MKICGLDLSISSSGVVTMELDDNFDVINVNCYGFTTVRKNEIPGQIIHYNLEKDFTDKYNRFFWLRDNIMNWVKGCDYAAIEDYAMGAKGSSGRIFDLGEYEGMIKMCLYSDNARIRLYAVPSIKKFFSAHGNSDKIGMREAFEKFQGVKPDISNLPYVNKGDGVAPTSDIIDAFAICEMLRIELKLRNGKMSPNELTDEQEIVLYGPKKGKKVVKKNKRYEDVPNYIDKLFLQKPNEIV